jgi:two-component system alkaline phosphatase synthesis response regulator PhoP
MLQPTVPLPWRSTHAVQLTQELVAHTHEKPVLITDDDLIVLKLYKALLNRASLNAIYTPNAREALQICKTQPVSAMITDICKPEISGLELLAILRNTPGISKLPAAIITASNTHVNILRARELQVPLIPKPIDPKELLGLLAYLIQRSAGV